MLQSGDGIELRAQCNATLVLKNKPHLWSPQKPSLYGVVAWLSSGDSVIDVVRSYTGLRTVSIDRTAADNIARIALNGKRLFMAGLLDQGYWPEGIYTAPSDGAMAADIRRAKALGFNLLRKHAKVEPARWYYHADRLGMLVWQDMPSPPAITCSSFADGDPNWKRHNDTRSEDESTEAWSRCPLDHNAFSRELREMLKSLASFPSVVLWVLFNEGWGQHATRTHVQTIRALGGTRLLTDASGWMLSAGNTASSNRSALPSSASWLERASTLAGACPPNAPCGDVIDVHAYPGPYPRKQHMRRWYGSGVWERLQWGRSPHRASVLGEFGGIRFELRGHTLSPYGWGYGANDAKTCEEYARHAVELWRQVGNIQGLAAAVYTQLTDVESEWNGLMTYDRVLKCGHEVRDRVVPAIVDVRTRLSALE